MEYEGEGAVRPRNKIIPLSKEFRDLGSPLVPAGLRGSMLDHKEQYLALWLYSESVLGSRCLFSPIPETQHRARREP